jgi:hypothetical protein
MVRMIASAAVVAVLMPVIWVSSAVWATGLAVGLVYHEAKHRLRRRPEAPA